MISQHLCAIKLYELKPVIPQISIIENHKNLK